MNKILRFVCRQADFKKIVSIGFFAAFFAVFLSAGTAQAGFFDWFNLNKANNDSQQAAAVTNTKATSTAATIKVISPNGGEVWKAGIKKNIVFKRSSSSRSSKSSATTTSVYLLKINKVGEGSVTDEQRQIVCGVGCKGDSGTYTAGSEAILTAVPSGGYVFERFSPEKECSSIYTSGFGLNDKQWIKQAFAYKEGENVVCVTNMNKNKTITAIFKKISSSSSSRSKSSSSRSSKSSSFRSNRSSATTTPSNV